MANRPHTRQRSVSCLLSAMALLVSATVGLAQERTRQRPIADFINAQGTFCFDDGGGGCLIFVPPVPNFIGWSMPPQQGNVRSRRCASVDYAGVANATIEALSGGGLSLGTTTSGTVIERPLADGRAEVTVSLHTANALVWVIDGGNQEGCDYAMDPLLFGHRPADVLAGADAALGSSFFQMKFINTAPGASLPDLLQLFVAPEPGQEQPSFLFFTARADGTLRDNFGVADGAPGRAEVIQTGLFMTRFQGATEDGFPAERIKVNAVGQ